MSQSIVNDPKSWGGVKPDPLAMLLVRCHAEVDKIFANEDYRKFMLDTMAKNSDTITLHLSVKPPF